MGRWHGKRWFGSSKTCHVCGYVEKDLLLQDWWRECPRCGTNHNCDTNVAINLQKLGVGIPVQRGKSTSVDMGALAFGNNKSETAVGIPVTERSRNLVEQAEQSAQATSPCL
ncbi:MAG: transposase [Treponema sp.]|nr:transposase [Treponema sp.]